MTDAEARDKAKITQEKRNELEVRKVDSIPEDIEFATLDDVDDLEPQFSVVPLKGKSGKIQNWLVRSLTAGERALADKSMFPKTVVKEAVVNAGKGKKSARDTLLDGIGEDDMVSRNYERNCAAIQIGTVFPENITIERIKRLPAEDFDKLINAVEELVNMEGRAARFHTDEPESDQEISNGSSGSI